MLEGQADLQSECPPGAGAVEECFVASALWQSVCKAHWMVLLLADDELDTHGSLSRLILRRRHSLRATFFATERA